MSAFATDLAAGLESVLSEAGGRMLYRRHQYSVEITRAARGKTDHVSIDGNGFSVLVRTADFLFDASELVLNGAVTEPLRGDQLVDLEAAGQPVFEVTQNKSLPSFKYSDAAQSRIRVHTIRLKK